MQFIQTTGRPIKAWTDGVQIEDCAMQQLHNLAAMPFIHSHVAVMPDVHWGMGATVGSVIATKGAVIPAAVGVDIGCGMIAAKTSLVANDLPDNLHGVRVAIEEMIPHGRTKNGQPGDVGAWDEPPDKVLGAYAAMSGGFDGIAKKHPRLFKRNPRQQTVCHMGTLGTGNHFIEICLDEKQAVWVMLHSGSRGVGNRIGSYFIEMAKKDMEKWFIHLPDADLAYLSEGTDHFSDYLEAVNWAQEFAATSRGLMLEFVALAMTRALGRSFSFSADVVNCHHNYVQKEHHFGENVWLTRKGAVRAREGDLGIIPGSMGTKSYIVRGKGNPQSFHTCSHGAGRAMSRREARQKFTLKDHARATNGVECRKDADVLDETPGAYKDIDAVMAAQADLVDIVHTLKQVVCVKG